jgi:hypothetical protein
MHVKGTGANQISPDLENLPGLSVKERGVVPGELQIHLKDVAVSINKPHISVVDIASSIKLLNRPFNDSNITASVRVMYPVRIVNFNPPELLGPNEKGIVNIAVKNISTKAYGERAGDSAVSIDVSCDHLAEWFQVEGTSTDGGYAWKARGRNCAITFFDIPAGSTVTAEIPIKSSKAAANNLFKDSHVEGTLKLRRKPISKYREKIRIVPVFDASKFYDVLLVTCDKIDRNEFLSWTFMFQLAGLQSGTWDIHRYKRLTAAPQLSWVGRVAHLVLPCFKGVVGPRDLYHQDVATHFSINNTSIILLGGDKVDVSHLRFTYKTEITPMQAGLIPCAPCLTVKCGANFLAHRGGQAADRDSVTKAAMLYNKQLQKNNLGGRTHQAVVDFDLPRNGFTRSWFGIHLDGASFYDSVLPAHAQLIVIDSPGNQEGSIIGKTMPFETKVIAGATQFFPTGAPIALDEAWGGVFSCLLSALPLYVKCQLLTKFDGYLGQTTYMAPAYAPPMPSKCCERPIEAHAVSFKWLMLSLLRDNIERSLVCHRSSLNKAAQEGISSYETIRLFFDSLPGIQIDPRMKSIATNILSAMIAAKETTTSLTTYLPCVAGTRANRDELKEFEKALGKMKAKLSDACFTIAKRNAAKIERRHRIIPARVHFPCVDPNETCDVISFQNAQEFTELNRRMCTVPVGEILLAQIRILHPTMQVILPTAVALPTWTTTAWVPPPDWAPTVKPTAHVVDIVGTLESPDGPSQGVATSVPGPDSYLGEPKY